MKNKIILLSTISCILVIVAIVLIAVLIKDSGHSQTNEVPTSEVTEQFEDISVPGNTEDNSLEAESNVSVVTEEETAASEVDVDLSDENIYGDNSTDTPYDSALNLVLADTSIFTDTLAEYGSPDIDWENPLSAYYQQVYYQFEYNGETYQLFILTNTDYTEIVEVTVYNLNDMGDPPDDEEYE